MRQPPTGTITFLFTDMEGSALFNLGVMAGMRGDWETARALYEQSLMIYREMGDRFKQATCLHSLGNVRLDLGEWEAACTFYEQSLAICSVVGNRGMKIENLLGLGL